jgi:hypothetical protein
MLKFDAGIFGGELPIGLGVVGKVFSPSASTTPLTHRKLVCDGENRPGFPLVICAPTNPRSSEYDLSPRLSFL